MNIVIDENISFAKQAFSQFGNVNLMPGRAISKEHLIDADILIVRSVTQINRNLLSDATVKFIGTTTIGTDHFDIKYLNDRKIQYASAPGCNSQAVAEYVTSAILDIYAKNNFTLEGKSIGIIGYGNIGTKVAKLAHALGLKPVINDPPKEREGKIKSASLEKVLACDIVTLHVPLNLHGIDKTHYLIDEKELNQLKKDALLINASRGPVINNSALLKQLSNVNSLFTVLDVWENEPEINQELLELVDIATPHIAGYSLEGKVNGTKIIYDRLCEFLGKDKIWEPILPHVSNKEYYYKIDQNFEENLNTITSQISNLEYDTIKFKAGLNNSSDKFGTYFDQLRKNYALRREFKNYFIHLNKAEPEVEIKLKNLGFTIIKN